VQDKPRVIVLSTDDADTFDWLSDGWNASDAPNPKLFKKAQAAIRKGKDVKDACRLLEEAGFEVVRAGGDTHTDDEIEPGSGDHQLKPY
jgi:hypothetical protein